MSDTLMDKQVLAGLNVGIVQLKAGRKTQEDAFFAVESSPRSSDLIPELLRQRFAEVAEKTKTHIFGGSTATVAVVSPDNKLTLAHLGDSPATLFVRNRQTGKVTFRDLIQPHRSMDMEEQEKIIKNFTEGSNCVAPATWMGSFPLSRAFGSKINGGILDTPDITTVDLSPYLQPDNQVFLCLVSDGVHVPGYITSENHAKTIEDFYRGDTTPFNAEQRIGLMMSARARGAGVEDNKTVIFTELKPLKKELILGVCDGHGEKGKEIADLVAASLKENLINNVEKDTDPGTERRTKRR